MAVKNAQGRIVVFDVEEFVDQIFSGQHCCLCGKAINDDNSNREHIIPDWLLRHGNLYQQTISLPNGTPFKYGQYVIPCCVSCNSEYGQHLEARISLLLTSGYDHFMRNATREDYQYLFVWLAWVYFKTHFKDTSLRLHRDRRKGDAMIGDLYDLSRLHHVHAIARSLHSGALLDDSCFGTLLVFRADQGSVAHIFDYRDFNALNTLLIRIDSLALLVSLDDGGECSEFMLGLKQGICDNALSAIQLRELLAHLTYERASLLQPPAYATAYYPASDTARIIQSQPATSERKEYEPRVYGELLYYSVHDLIGKSGFADEAAAVEAIKSGNGGFMFDERNRFVANGAPLRA